MTTSEWLDLFQKASEERAAIYSERFSRYGKEPYVVEPFFPGFRLMKASGDVSYSMAGVGPPLRTPRPRAGFGDLTKPHARLRAAVLRCGLTGRMERNSRPSREALFDREKMGLSWVMEAMPWETAYCLEHELAHFVLHRMPPNDAQMIKHETMILKGFIAASCSETVFPPYVFMERSTQDVELPALKVPSVRPGIRSKLEMLASRQRLMIGAATIEDLFR